MILIIGYLLLARLVESGEGRRAFPLAARHLFFYLAPFSSGWEAIPSLTRISLWKRATVFGMGQSSLYLGAFFSNEWFSLLIRRHNHMDGPSSTAAHRDKEWGISLSPRLRIDIKKRHSLFWTAHLFGWEEPFSLLWIFLYGWETILSLGMGELFSLDASQTIS